MMPRKLSLQTTIRRRSARISICSQLCRRAALSIVRRKAILVDYSQIIGVLGEGHPFFAGRDLPARLSGKETKKEKSFYGRLQLSSAVAKTNEVSPSRDYQR